MTVRRTTWHYRLWKIGRKSDSEPYSLCKYFWHIFLLKVILPAALAGLVLVGIGSLVWVIVKNPVEAGLATAVAAILVAIVLGIIVLVKSTEERRAARKKQREYVAAMTPPKPPKEPSLFWEFIKAKKRKVCPLIQVVD
jgi:glucan phosphoethanolaminetransferase (alkaline phosphatase superfamily)